MLNFLELAAASVMALGLLASMPTASVAQEPVKLRVLSAWDGRFEGSKLVGQRFVENVDKLSGGRITFTFNGPEVVPVSQQFEPVSKGVFDLHFSTPPFYAGNTSVPSAFLALPADTAYLREKGYWEFADKEFQRFNQKLLGIYNAPDQLQLVLREPLGKAPRALEGRKIRGNPIFEAYVGPLGAAIINLPPAEIYSAIEKGVVDGAGLPIVGTFEFRIQEVAKYYTTPAFGRTFLTLTFNLAKFNALSQEDQKILLDAARMVEESSPAEFAASAKRAIEQLRQAGMQESKLPAELVDPLKEAFDSAQWELAIKSNPAAAGRIEELREMARANGDTK